MLFSVMCPEEAEIHEFPLLNDISLSVFSAWSYSIPRIRMHVFRHEVGST